MNNDGIKRRNELRRSSAVDSQQFQVNCVNLTFDCQRLQRPLTISYELSEDLREKEIEFTERRFGGRYRSHQAARIIQSSYREYQLRRDYKKLKIEKRVSRKLDLPSLNSHNTQSYISPTIQVTSESILEMVKNDLKKQNSYEDLVIEQAYRDWDKDISHDSPDTKAKLAESTKQHPTNNDDQKYVANADSGVDSVENSSTSLTPSPTTMGSFPVLSSSPSLVISKSSAVSTCASKCTSGCGNVNNATHSQNASSGGDRATDSKKHSSKSTNKPIPISHSTTLCDTKRQALLAKNCTGNSNACCDLNNSFHGPSAASASSSSTSPKYKNGEFNCCSRSNIYSPIYQCNNSDRLNKFSPSALAGYLSNPRLIGGKFQKSCYCQAANERRHKRLYRICLNIFNKNSSKGVSYLIRFKFVEPQPNVLAKFLMTRKGISRYSIGDYLGHTKDDLATETLKFFVRMVDMRNKDIDVALRYLLSFFQIPGESQKIKSIMEEFQESYMEQNQHYWPKFCINPDTIMILAYAIIMLHTDMYNPNIRKQQKMSKEDFIRNLRNVDDGHDIDPNLLTAIYDRIRAAEMKTFSDHTDQVRKIDQHFSGNLRPRNLIQPHRRLVCYCRLFEVVDCYKKDRIGAHQREVFLFNDLLVTTKGVQKRKKDGVMYQCRNVISLSKVEIYLFETIYYPFGIQLKRDDEILATFNTRTVTDRKRFVEDLIETITEVSEMDRIRIEDELSKQQRTSVSSNIDVSRDSTLYHKGHKSESTDTSDRNSQEVVRRKDLSSIAYSASVSTDEPKLSPAKHHHRSSSHGANIIEMNSDVYSSFKNVDMYGPHSNVYNQQNRISGDSGLQEDIE